MADSDSGMLGVLDDLGIGNDEMLLDGDGRDDDDGDMDILGMLRFDSLPPTPERPGVSPSAVRLSLIPPVPIRPRALAETSVAPVLFRFPLYPAQQIYRGQIRNFFEKRRIPKHAKVAKHEFGESWKTHVVFLEFVKWAHQTKEDTGAMFSLADPIRFFNAELVKWCDDRQALVEIGANVAKWPEKKQKEMKRRGSISHFIRSFLEEVYGLNPLNDIAGSLVELLQKNYRAKSICGGRLFVATFLVWVAQKDLPDTLIAVQQCRDLRAVSKYVENLIRESGLQMKFASHVVEKDDDDEPAVARESRTKRVKRACEKDKENVVV